MEWLHGMGKILLGQGEEREVWTGEHILGILGDGVTFYGENGTFFFDLRCFHRHQEDQHDMILLPRVKSA